MKYKTKQTLKTIVSAILAVVVVGGAVGMIAGLLNKDDGFEKVSVSYDIGGLNAEGKYEETDGALYTKTGFDVEGKTVFADVDFDAQITYQLFYYGENDTFIESTAVLTDDYKAEAPEGALTCRVEITPIWGEDVKAEDQKVTWLNKVGFAGQLDLSVKAVETEKSSSSAAA